MRRKERFGDVIAAREGAWNRAGAAVMLEAERGAGTTSRAAAPPNRADAGHPGGRLM